MDDVVQKLVDLALSADMLMTAAGIFALLRALRRFPVVSDRNLYRRALPVLPETLGCLVALSSGLPSLAGQPLPLKIAAGLWTGYLAQRIHKILGQTILGDDASMEERKS